MKRWEDPTIVREAAVAAIWLYAEAATNNNMVRKIAAQQHYLKLAALIAALIVNATNLTLERGAK